MTYGLIAGNGQFPFLAQSPNITVTELRKKLLDSVDKHDDLKGKVATGGTLCAANALGVED